MKENILYTKYAFISYNHLDIKMAKWLHRKLESYKLPTKIHNEIENSKYLRPIFRDQEDLSSGVLGDELRKNLIDSKFLVVICSPNSAKSNWVNNEVKCFIDNNRIDKIIPLIIKGVPNSNSNDECLPLALREYVALHPDKELLGVNVNEVGKHKAFIRIVSKMLDVSFDELWKRHERERKKKVLLRSFMTPIIVFLLYWFMIPISLKVKIMDEKHHLPIPEDAILMINNAKYPISCLDTTIKITSIPGYYRLKKIPCAFKATYYKKIITQTTMSYGLQSTQTIHLSRDKTFAIYSGRIIDEQGDPVFQTLVKIGNRTTTTDRNGIFNIEFPTNEQTKTKSVKISKTNMKDIYRKDECPSNEIMYVLHTQP